MKNPSLILKNYPIRRTAVLAVTGLLSCFFSVLAQSPTQVVRGTVFEADRHRPLAGATVTLAGTDRGTITDPQGRFRLTEVPLGRHQLLVSFVGYESTVVNEVLVESGKEQVIDVRLRAGAAQLQEATVVGARTDRSVSAEHITVEQVLRFPASYLDPARLATAYAGVINTNDQANNISIRGNSPNGLTWRLEGVEIVNPNHLSNAGTIGDRPTASGGGVNVLSAQMLGTTRFLTGAFSPEYGNTLSGVLDMSLRPGNNERHEMIAQAGLIGLDLAAEGPLSRPKEGGRAAASYLINYRYSFTGLLGALGISFGGEAISFQDLSVNLVFPTRKGGRLSLFGVGGSSRNRFEGKVDSLRQEDKDRYNIGFSSLMGAGGLTFAQPLGERFQLNLSAVLSGNFNGRDQSPATRLPRTVAYQEDNSINLRSTVTGSLTYRVNARDRLRAGVYLTHWNGSVFVFRDTVGYNSSIRNGVYLDDRIRDFMIQPYLNYEWRPTPELTVNGGLHYNRFTLNRASSSLEPRASVNWEVRPGNTVSLAYGRHSQAQQPIVYLSPVAAQVGTGASNRELDFTKAHHIVAGYRLRLSEASYVKAEAYWQELFNVPVSRLSPGADNLGYSVLNLLDTEELAVRPEPLVNAGKGRNKGVELTYQRYLAKSFYLLATGSVYDSKYQSRDGRWRDTRFNGRYAFNLTSGKEFLKTSGNTGRIWGLNGRLTYAGGFLDRPIDEAASGRFGYTYYQGQEFSVRLPDYFRLDLRVYWKKSRARYSRTLSLDLQNATNARNVAYSYFDAVQGKVVRKNQLGILPILNYRWEF